MSEPSSSETPAGRAPSDGERRGRNAARTKAEILAAGRAEFSARGFEGARVDAIAERAGANKRLLYHYFGNKEELYCAVLLDAYQEIRRGERALSLDRYGPVEAMDRLVRFTFRHFLANPWFTRLLTTENLENARFLKTLPDIPALHSPLVGQIETIIARGAEKGLFRRDADPIQLYISVAALGYFYVSNMKTLSVIFARDLEDIAMVQEREAHAVEMVLDYLKTGA
ncbi:TetR/AcrR family transcriptional regulator [Arsenicitalea aurantiaca]|uniref:TetR/AcrR family transcriptional regulator n=1 Tax=Arsenicitalea aurantiaca TaxID=1783274 RepID=A0A433X7M5_9HYPH|nr:TetR/AcrR family transcriptional regulator [Arsenicitalea aurantiaca]RUT30050.1 TetR/AcrR family transcriptional regulator [Arsenicitalea aurantiaca]